MAQLCLASQSPRRAELLSQIGVRFFQSSADIDETPLADEPAIDYVCRLALAKAQAVAATIEPDNVVLGADTIVVCDQQLLGKPKDQAQALAYLSLLSGRSHQVVTAVAVGRGADWQVEHCVSQVRFNAISPEQALAYWHTGEPADKAGGYGIQGKGAVFVAGIEGCYSNIVGLPLALSTKLLTQFDIAIWQAETGA